MPDSLAQRFREELNEIRLALEAVPHEIADIPWRTGGWTRKQIVGHLLDSAANNRQRFVRAATEGKYAGPTYAQDAWVAAHGYKEQPWTTLLAWWQSEHEILIAVVENIPTPGLESMCLVGENQPVSLRFLIEDYLSHQQWHLKQIRTALPLL
jgi:Mycothiol maleylpyruvate isomerase N-terminal domain